MIYFLRANLSFKSEFWHSLLKIDVVIVIIHAFFYRSIQKHLSGKI